MSEEFERKVSLNGKELANLTKVEILNVLVELVEVLHDTDKGYRYLEMVGIEVHEDDEDNDGWE